MIRFPVLKLPAARALRAAAACGLLGVSMLAGGCMQHKADTANNSGMASAAPSTKTANASTTRKSGSMMAMTATPTTRKADMAASAGPADHGTAVAQARNTPAPARPAAPAAPAAEMKPPHKEMIMPSLPSNVIKTPFGTTTDGKAVELYTLTNKHGYVAKVITYGATLNELIMPDRIGKMGDVVLGFDNIGDYQSKSPFFGATAGRVANRIAGGTFELDGNTYNLAVNNGPNTLHGGKVGFDKKIWTAKVLHHTDGPAVQFHYLSPDMEENFPGNLDVTVTYTLTDANELRIDYKATTDKDTIVNLTNHSYWNLSACKSPTILDEVLYINADKYTPVDDTMIPTGKVRPVFKTPFDFTVPTAIGARIKDIVALPPGGYDHNFVLNGEPGALKLCARAIDNDSGRQLEIWTTEPAVQFYTGNFLDGTIKGIHGHIYPKNGAFCLETQHYPDSIHQPDFPSTVLKPGQVYTSTTIHKLSVR